MKRDEAHTDPGKKKAAPKKGPAKPKRRTAIDETDRLTNMCAAITGTASLIPIPGTSAAMTGTDLLLMGAITRVWGHPITEGYVAGIFRYIGGVLVVGLGAHVVADVFGVIPGVGTLLKPAMNAGVTKFLGSSMREYFTKEYGKDKPADITAEEAKAMVERAVARMAVYGPDLASGAKEAFKGDGKKLARTMRRLFGDESEEAPAADAEAAYDVDE